MPNKKNAGLEGPASAMNSSSQIRRDLPCAHLCRPSPPDRVVVVVVPVMARDESHAMT
jgi:hypothetical protein